MTSAATRAARRAAGQCIDCGADAAGATLCAVHKAAHAAAVLRRRAKLRTAGKCHQCGRRRSRPGKQLCRVCAVTARRYKRRA